VVAEGGRSADDDLDAPLTSGNSVCKTLLLPIHVTMGHRYAGVANTRLARDLSSNASAGE
jgi:hypothetical protein